MKEAFTLTKFEKKWRINAHGNNIQTTPKRNY
jgi:hypothetical protein